MFVKNIILVNGLLKKAVLNGVLFEDFSIEFSDKFSFFTLTEKPRFIIKKLIKSEEQTDFSKALYSIQTIQGYFELEVATKVNKDNNFILIEAELKSLEDVYIQDFVIRMKARKNKITNIFIKNLNIEHNNSQKYHQYNTNNLIINSIDNKKIKITRTNNDILDNAENHFYARDLNEFWIFHSRLFPSKKPSQFNLRWITNYFWISLNHQLSKIISSLPIVRKKLWYRKERIGKNALEIQLIGLIKFNKNKKIKQKIKIEYNSD